MLTAALPPNPELGRMVARASAQHRFERKWNPRGAVLAVKRLWIQKPGYVPRDARLEAVDPPPLAPASPPPDFEWPANWPEDLRQVRLQYEIDSAGVQSKFRQFKRDRPRALGFSRGKVWRALKDSHDQQGGIRRDLERDWIRQAPKSYREAPTIRGLL